MATFYEKSELRFCKGDEVLHYDKVQRKNIKGIVTGISQEGISVLWEDFPEDEIVYDFDKIEIKGNQIFDNGERAKLKSQNLPTIDDEIFGSWGGYDYR